MKNVWPPYKTFEARRKWYRTVYLNGTYWTDFSRSYRQSHPTCEYCGVARSKQVHHTSFGYEVLGFEGKHPGCVMAVCKPCHAFLDETRRKANMKNFRTSPPKKRPLRDAIGRFLKKAR